MPSEFALIRRFFTRETPTAVLGVGDDAALLAPTPGMQLAVSTDMLVEGRHFAPQDGPGTVGHKSLAVNLSDMAAMGATPRWVTLALASPGAGARWQRRVDLMPLEAASCLPRLRVPQPQVALGLALRGVASAAIDV